MSTSTVSSISRARKGVFSTLDDAGIVSRDDRIELARDIIGRDIESFTELTTEEWNELHFALQSWKKVQLVRRANEALVREAEHLVQFVHELDLSDIFERRSVELPNQSEEN